MRDPDPDFAARLLAWYDRNARVLPWRVPPGSGHCPDPYRVWLSEVMLQQTTVAAVDGYFRRFTARWPDLPSLAAANDADLMAEWAGLGYYARARNLLKCARHLAASGGFPQSEAELRLLPGIGPYTAAAIAAIAFDRPATVVDGNVERVIARLFAIETPLPAAKPLLHAKAAALTPAGRPGDYAQAMMDLGATICTPRNPSCIQCPVATCCAASAQGIAARLPVRSRRPAKPLRTGTVWVALRSNGAFLTVTRPPSGLLGGMLALPSAGWDGTPPQSPPLAADWQDIGEVTHVFTHFRLRLRVLRCRLPARSPGHFEQVVPESLPGLFRKALLLALKA